MMSRSEGMSGGSGGGATAYTAQSSASGTINPQFAGLPVLQKEIIKFMTSQPASDEGIHVAAIARHVGNLGLPKGDAQQIRYVTLSKPS